ncbi:MAG: DUF6884 domain-containing protein [Pseudomonadota bacterium]
MSIPDTETGDERIPRGAKRVGTMRTLCIVPCGKTKIWDKYPKAGPTMAKHVYTGPFAKKCRGYAELFYPDSWYILSAKYGFLKPGDIIPGPYNVSFNSKKTHPIDIQTLKKQAGRRKLNRFSNVVVLGGRNYVAIAREVFSTKPIHAPLTGSGGIGNMMKRLNELIAQGVSG